MTQNILTAFHVVCEDGYLGHYESSEIYQSSDLDFQVLKLQ